MKIFAIGINTAREAIRNRVLYSILFFALLVVAVSAVFGAASIGDQMKFVKDFSLMSVSLFGVIIAIVLGVNLLHQELGKKTIFNILSKPVARWEFMVGKFAGLVATLGLILTLMCVALMGFLFLLEQKVDWGLAIASGVAFFEIVVVIAVALFFSALVVTPTLAGLFTAATFVAGRSSGYLAYFYSDDHPPVVRGIAKALSWALPKLDRFNISEQVVYGEHLDVTHLTILLTYAMAYAGVLLLLSIALFSRREFT
jgi:ABC-type transport system involved in multi-copper enzyme maturation permease subunit